MSDLHLTDYLFGLVYKYFTTILLFEKLDLDNLDKSFKLTKSFFTKLSFNILFIDCDNLNLKNYINNRVIDTKSNKDIMITIIQNKLLTLLVIDTNHQKVDGMLLFNIIDYWSILYKKNSSIYNDYKLESTNITNIINNYKGNYPVNKMIISTLKEKYPFSDYVIVSILWSYYISKMSTKRKFGHVISNRTPGEKYTIGNFITVIGIELSDSFYESCLLLQNTIKRIKSIKTNKIVNYSSLLLNYCKCDVIFDSWLSFKHITFNDKKNIGIYSNNFKSNSNINIVEYVTTIAIHNDYYYLTHSINDCGDNNHFIEFINEFLYKCFV
jgi:hypothetical protein